MSLEILAERIPAKLMGKVENNKRLPPDRERGPGHLWGDALVGIVPGKGRDDGMPSQPSVTPQEKAWISDLLRQANE